MEYKKSFYCGAVLLTAALPGTALSAVYEVSPVADSDCSDGKCSFQAALNAAESNNGSDTTLRLSQGRYTGNYTYFPSGDNTGSLEIQGGWNTDFSSRSSNPSETVLDGNHTGTVLNLKFADLENPVIIGGDLKLDGVTVKNGEAYIAGGILAFTAAPYRIDISNCIIEDNHAEDAAGGCAVGVYDWVNTTTDGTLYVEGNIIRNNSVAGASDGNSGGCDIFINGLGVIRNNLVYGNTVGTAELEHGVGGGLSMSILAGNLYFENNTITDNHITAAAGSDASGGGIGVSVTTLGNGFPVAWAPGHAYLHNNIIFNNSVSTDYGNDISNYVRDNDSSVAGSSLVIGHSAYADLWTGMHSVEPQLSQNISADPLLSTNSSTLYQLTDTSPCIDTGLSSAPYLPENDLAGNLRELDGDKDGNSVVDMGCYEYNGQKTESNVWTLFLPAILCGRDVPPADVPTVTSATGRVWMDRNLGASRVAISSDDSQAYGDLYQWGRLTDGHEKRDSSTTDIQSNSDIPGHDDFIIGNNNWQEPFNQNLWQDSGINNPCPSGFRIPTETEWEAERLSWSSNNPAGAFASPLKLTTGGYRIQDGTIKYAGLNGSYWSNDTGTYTSNGLHIYTGGVAGMAFSSHSYGMSIRCIKEE